MGLEGKANCDLARLSMSFCLSVSKQVIQRSECDGGDMTVEDDLYSLGKPPPWGSLHCRLTRVNQSVIRGLVG